LHVATPLGLTFDFPNERRKSIKAKLGN